MSLATWTPAALSSELRRYKQNVWRLVEAQHKVSTFKLADSLEDQALLEQLIETTKPPVPPECRDLHFLLSTPFRYDAPYPIGSRFRQAGKTPGVFYASEHCETAIAEIAFYRLLFFAESPGTPWPSDAAEYSALCVSIKSSAALDLLVAPLNRDQALWTKENDYAPCQTLAGTAREAGATVIRYQSVRDRQKRANVAVLSCAAFAESSPSQLQTWRIKCGPTGVFALCEFPSQRIGFGRDEYANSARLKKMKWER